MDLIRDLSILFDTFDDIWGKFWIIWIFISFDENSWLQHCSETEVYSEYFIS